MCWRRVWFFFTFTVCKCGHFACPDHFYSAVVERKSTDKTGWKKSETSCISACENAYYILDWGIGNIIIRSVNKNLWLDKEKQNLPHFVNKIPLFFHCSFQKI